VFKISPPEETIDLRMVNGNIVHSVLEFAYNKAGEGAVPNLEKTKEKLREYWKPVVEEIGEKFSKEEIEKIIKKSTQNIEWYFFKKFQPQKEATIGVEQKIVYPLNYSQKEWIIAFLDRITQPEENVIVIHDYKTGKLLHDEQTLPNDFQASLYGAMAAHKYSPLKEIQLQWHYLSHEKTIQTTLEPENCRNAIQHAQYLASQIRYSLQKNKFNPKKGNHCGYCEFASICSEKN
jgi:CRISPR/Cas system-associated exonuclease Cas4 (RecB family)